MRIEHELTPADLATYQAMMLVASPPVRNRSIAALTAVYAMGGGWLIGHFFNLTFWGYMALWVYALGLIALIVVALKLAAARQVTQFAEQTSMKREYLITDTGLEVRMPDLIQTILFARIVAVESGGRGTVVRLAQSTPMFLPFGSAFRGEFVEALRERVKRG